MGDWNAGSDIDRKEWILTLSTTLCTLMLEYERQVWRRRSHIYEMIKFWFCVFLRKIKL